MQSPFYTRLGLTDPNTSPWTVGTVADLSAFYNYSSADLADFVRQYIVPVNNDADLGRDRQITSLRNKLIDFYTDQPNASSTNPVFYFMQYTHLVTDVEFIVPALWEARIKSQYDWPLHLFHFDHVSASVLADLPYPGAWHAGDGPYDLGSPSWDLVSFNGDDLAVQAALVSAMVKFIKNGHPSSDGSSWPALNFTGSACNQANKNYAAENVNPHPYVESVGVGGSEIAKRLAFWDGLASKFDLRIVQSFPNTMGQCVPA